MYIKDAAHVGERSQRILISYMSGLGPSSNKGDIQHFPRSGPHFSYETFRPLFGFRQRLADRIVHHAYPG